MIEGMIQEVEYGSSAAALNWICKKDGKTTKPDATPTIIVYDSGGDTLVSSTNMSAVSVSTKNGRGFLAYDAQTAGFTVGAVLVGKTGGATARIERVEDSGKTGVLVLSNIWGTFQDNETITDSDSGSADANGAAYTCEYTYALDASSTTNFGIGEDYHFKVTYAISSVTYHDLLYFDVVYHTFMEPLVSTEYVDRLHPDWKQWHPDGENATWESQIEVAHMELSRRIRALGNRPAFIVKREELFPYELAFVEGEVAKRLMQMSTEERGYWTKQAEVVWNSRGEFAYDKDDDSEIDEDPKVFSSGFTR